MRLSTWFRATQESGGIWAQVWSSGCLQASFPNQQTVLLHENEIKKSSSTYEYL